MKPTQCKMARTGLGWSAHDLATAAGVGYATVARFETGGTINAASLAALNDALAGAGASLLAKGDLVGVMVPE